MGWKLLYRWDRSARVVDVHEKEIEEVYELDSELDFDAFLVSFKRKGGVVVEYRQGIAFYFTIERVELRRRPPMASGKLQVEASITLSVLRRSNRLIPPWELAPFRFKVATASAETTTSQFFPGVGDLLHPQGSFQPRPFVNTAFVPLRGKTTYANIKIAFSYNAPLDAFDPRMIWAPIGKINLRTTTICGMKFPPRTVRLEAFGAEYATESVETRDDDGNIVVTTWKFYRVDVALVVNPRSYDQLFANVGSHVNINGTLYRIWRWTNPQTQKACYGTYAEYLASGAIDGETVSTPLPLTANGQAVSPIYTFRVGSPFEPVDFAALRLPSEPPVAWDASALSST